MMVLNTVGTLGQDPEIKTNKGGKEYLSYSIAVETGFGDKKETVWLGCSQYRFGKGVTAILTKGARVFISGALSTWTNKEGKTKLQVDVNDMKIVATSGPKRDAGKFGDVKPRTDVASSKNVPFDMPDEIDFEAGQV